MTSPPIDVEGPPPPPMSEGTEGGQPVLRECGFRGLRRIVVEGFRSLRAVDLELGPITVIIGPNGAGKSNLLAVLRLFRTIHDGMLRTTVGRQGGANALLHYGAKVTPHIRLRAEFQEEEKVVAYEANLVYASGDRFVVEDEYTFFRSCGDETFTPQIVSLSGDESRLRELARVPGPLVYRAVSAWLPAVRCFHLHDTSPEAPIRQQGRRVDDQAFHPHGENLAPFLYRLKHSDSEGDQAAWRRIIALTRRVAPAVRELDPVLSGEAGTSSGTVRLDWLDDRGHRFGVHDLSDGTLRAVALFTALSLPDDSLPPIVCIDEPELGLHPAALHLFAALVRSVATRCQVILATQSSALLDHFEPEEVVVAERHDGGSQFRRINTEDLRDWLGEYTLSDLFDKNMLGGRP